MKSFKHEHLFYLLLYIQSEHIVISTAQTDLGLRSRTFPLKLISCLHFLKLLKHGSV